MGRSVETVRTTVTFGQCDPNGHLNTAHYTALFDRATWDFLLAMGVRDEVGRNATVGWADVRVLTEYKQEVTTGEAISIVSSVVRIGTKSATLRHEMRKQSDETLCATYECVSVRFDLVNRRAIPVPALLREWVG